MLLQRLALGRIVAVLLFASALAASTQAADTPVAAPPDSASAASPIAVTQWLVLGPAPAPLPVFHDDKEKGFTATDLAGAGALDARRLAPRAAETVTVPGGGVYAWRPTDAADLVLERPPAEQPAEAWLATRLATGRWFPGQLTVDSAHPVRAWLDGQPLALDPAKDDPAKTRRNAPLKLVPGLHLLLLHAVGDPAVKEPWHLAVTVTPGAGVPAEALTVTTSPLRGQDIHDVLDAPTIRSAAISPDGRLIALSLAEVGVDGRRDSWVEVRRAADGRPERTWRGALDMGSVRWAPSGTRLSYTSERDGKTTMWLLDLGTGEATPLVRDIENLTDYNWSPDGTFLVYGFQVKAEPDKRKVKHVENLADRVPDWRDRSYLVQVAVPGGASRRLTAGQWNADNWRLAPDGKRLLFFREWPDYAARPYVHRELWELDLQTLAAQQVLADAWIESAEYGPDPNVLALQGAPSAFGGLGRDLPAGVVANDYGGQLYLYDRRSAQATPVSRDFDPDLSRVVWNRNDGRIYAKVTEGQYANLYALDPDSRKWTRLATAMDVLDDFDLAAHAPLGIALGSSAALPQRLTLVDLKRGQSRVIVEPAASRYNDVRCGRVEDWGAKLPTGETLDGRVYYPLDFDPHRSYPCIVYFYGGTSPVERDFGGRYPKNVWAALGYFVYVPQPSGATGYGQEMAARHVNDWGIRTAQEVIDATKAFLAAHPRVDKSRLACMGASYGGFLTEYLVTRTDLFACAISHAGISSIASYWGAGFWGYDYGARALANTFPWSERSLYIDQSPLYNADKIKTPLLMLHGSADTNVPTGESDQLFAALKLLGREVEYVQIEGQNHHVLDHDQRIVWNDTILAWLAKWLKNEPQWWGDMYPK